MLEAFASEQQKETYLTPMIEGRWFGTMCLSEPHAGSSLSDIRTKATPTDEGHYLIEGSKMWISGGDQDISENIVEMVLAKIPGGPPGVKGISLFIVPKYRVKSDGSLGEFNNIALAGLNHKMGMRGTTNCLLNFGEKGECHGFLVGEPHQGLRYMFHMMNEARIAVGFGASILGLCGFLYSLDYAKNRPQGRHPGDKDPNSLQVMFIEHADVKRMLMAQKAYVEGALGLVLYAQNLIDQNDVSDDPNANQHRNLLLEILTPIVKSWPSEYCLEANKLAIQVLGGYGYTRDYPVERFYRDNRLNHIHEGTHAIHGIDLLGRKVVMHDGAALKALTAQMQATIDAASNIETLADYAQDLKSAINAMHDTTKTATGCDDAKQQLANATAYLDAVGHIVIAWIWLKQATVAEHAIAKANSSDQDFYRGKLSACRFFFRYELPKVYPAFELVSSLDRTCLDATAEEFIGL
jgi:butyryl-CoA dehydrogenase